jgi:hypothetical protein
MNQFCGWQLVIPLGVGCALGLMADRHGGSAGGWCRARGLRSVFTGQQYPTGTPPGVVGTHPHPQDILDVIYIFVAGEKQRNIRPA